MPALPKRLNTAILILIIVCAGLICYANSFKVPFLWDDEVLILRNHYVKSWDYLRPIFTSSHFRGGGEAGNFYRPLQVVSYLLDYSLWGNNPFGFHLTNLILHCAVAVAVFFLVKRISADSLAGFLAALFFVVHPVHTEAVTYISGRADMQVALFLLLALLCFLRIPAASGLKRWLYWAGAGLFYICALLSKEIALIFLILVFFYDFCFIERRQIKSRIIIYLTFLVISSAYIFGRMKLLAFPQASSLAMIAQAPLLQRLLTVPKIYLTYLGLLMFPVYLHMERHFLVTNLSDPYFCWGSLLLLLTAWFLKLAYRRWRPVFFYCGWFIITLIPVLNILPLNATCAEHWLYLPAIGFWGLAATLAGKLFRQAAKKFKTMLLLLCGLLLVFYCSRTVMRNFQWYEPIKLYAHDLKYSPQSFLLHNNLGVELFRAGRLAQAGAEFAKAAEISPRYAVSRNNLGVVLENKGKIDEALVQYQAAIDLNNYVLAYGNLGRTYLKIKQPVKAEEILEQGEKLYPHNVEITYYLARAYYQQDKFDLAREKFEKAAQLAPHFKSTDIYLEKLKGHCP